MVRKRVRLWMSLALMCYGLSLAGCSEGNIFGWTASAEENEIGDLLEGGQVLMTKGKFAEAKEKFARADSLANHTNSDALYLHAKATMQASGISIVSLIRDVTENASQAGALPLVTSDPNLSQAEDIQEKNTIYQTNITIVDDLIPIREGQATGIITAEDIRIDYALANSIKGLLRLRDFNGDGQITDQDVVLDVERVLDMAQDFQISGQGEEIKGLESVVTDSASADQLNNLIAAVAGDSASGQEGILEETLDALLELPVGSVIDSADVEELRENIDEIADASQAFMVAVNTGEPGSLGWGDNDGDWDPLTDDLNGNGQADSDYDGPDLDGNGDGNPLFDPEPNVDEETINGLDDDGDGLVDEDSHYIRGVDF